MGAWAHGRMGAWAHRAHGETWRMAASLLVPMSPCPYAPMRPCAYDPANASWLGAWAPLSPSSLAVAIVVWGPAYARGLSLVVRAAHLDGWLRRAADFQARPWQAGPAQTIPTRHGAIPARVYRPVGDSRRAVVLTPGVHAMGIEEPRLKGLAGELAATGLTVVTIASPDRHALPLHAAVRRPDRGRREVAAGAARPGAGRQGGPDGHQLRRRPVARRRGPAARFAIAWPTCSRSAATAICRAR